MCTPACSVYQNDINYLQGQTSISPSNSILRKLQSKSNLTCIKNFLASIATKIK